MLRCAALTSIALVLSSSGCSAVVSPDPGRLGGDGGPASGRDAAVVPGTDSATSCGAGLVDCGGTCAQLASDPRNCGGCGHGCGTTEACVSGVCSGSNGGPLGNPGDCGASHASCAALQVCVSGACVCRPPYTDVGGRCIDLASDPDNCGAPGHACPDRCAGGVCIRMDCPGATTSCDGACVDLRRDPGNCGDCGRACRGNQVCAAGNCRDVFVPGGCTSCPCDGCGAAPCCAYPGVGVPVCVDGGGACP